MSLEKRNKAQILSGLLSDLNYPLLAEYASKETSEEMMRGYLRVIEHKAWRLNDDNLKNIVIGLKLNF